MTSGIFPSSDGTRTIMQSFYLFDVSLQTTRTAWDLIRFGSHVTFVKLQNLTRHRTGFVSKQVLQLLSRLQNWIYPKTCQYKTCIISNTNIVAPSGTTRPKPWPLQLTSETVKIFIKAASLVPVQSRFGAAGLVSAQSRFRAAGLVSAQSQFWCGRFSVSTKAVLCGRLSVSTKPVLCSRFSVSAKPVLCVRFNVSTRPGFFRQI